MVLEKFWCLLDGAQWLLLIHEADSHLKGYSLIVTVFVVGLKSNIKKVGWSELSINNEN